MRALWLLAILPWLFISTAAFYRFIDAFPSDQWWGTPLTITICVTIGAVGFAGALFILNLAGAFAP